MAWTVKYVRADATGGGTGNTHAVGDAYNLAEAIAHSALNAGVQYVVSAAGGAYATSAAPLTFNGSGTTTAPNWWRGSNSGTTINDCELDPTLAKPSLTFSFQYFKVTGNHQIFSDLSISGTQLGVMLSLEGMNYRFDRVRVENTQSYADGYAVSVYPGPACFTECWLKANATATVVVESVGPNHFLGCHISGGGIGLAHSSLAVNVAGSVFHDNGSHAIQISTTNGIAAILGCSIYSPGGDGVRVSALPTEHAHVIANTIFSECTGYGINNSTGTATNFIHRNSNHFHSNGGTENGFGDTPGDPTSGVFGSQSEATSPFTNAASGDLSLLSTSTAKGTGSPGRFENQSYTSYLDRGAVQRQEAGGGGGGIYRRRMRPLGV